MKIGFVFSGQGAQYLGMGKEFYETNELFKKRIDEASQLLELDIPHIMFNDEEKLHLTEYTQPVILAVSVAISDLIKDRFNLSPSMVAGLSLGEYTALVESGALSFEEAIKLVRTRGKLMQEAVPPGVGAMTAVMGLDRQTVIDACKTASQVEGVYPANFNMPGQIVIGGYQNGVKKAEEILEEAGAKRLIPLKVSGPFHTPLLKPAADKLNTVLNETTFNDMAIPVVTNVNGKVVVKKEDLVDTLTKQVMSSVYFEDCIETMIDAGIDTFIEIGPGKTLSSFIKKISKNVKVQNVEDEKTLARLAKQLAKD